MSCIVYYHHHHHLLLNVRELLMFTQTKCGLQYTVVIYDTAILKVVDNIQHRCYRVARLSSCRHRPPRRRRLLVLSSLPVRAVRILKLSKDLGRYR